MPFTRRTARRPGRHLVTLDQLNRANVQVTTEMEDLGLWHPKLDDVTVWLVPASFACYGWFKDEDDIYVPSLTGAQLSDLMSGHHTRLTDILRHEWAHALADRRPGLVRRRLFREAFGGSYRAAEAPHAYDPDCHITAYAATRPCEDFAEVFSYYLRHKGRLPVRLRDRPVIVRKWRFVASTTQS